MNPLGQIAEALLEAGASLTGDLLQKAAIGGGAALGGPVGGALAGIVVGSLKDALGLPAEATEKQVADKMKEDPVSASVAAQRVEAQQGAAISEVQARLADIADARAMQVTAVQSGGWTAFTPHVLAYMNAFAFFGVIAALFFKAIPENNIAMILIGALISEFRGAMAFFFGSSTSSKGKDQVIEALSHRSADASAKLPRK